MPLKNLIRSSRRTAPARVVDLDRRVDRDHVVVTRDDERIVDPVGRRGTRRSGCRPTWSSDRRFHAEDQTTLPRWMLLRRPGDHPRLDEVHDPVRTASRCGCRGRAWSARNGVRRAGSPMPVWSVAPSGDQARDVARDPGRRGPVDHGSFGEALRRTRECVDLGDVHEVVAVRPRHRRVHLGEHHVDRPMALFTTSTEMPRARHSPRGPAGTP